MDRAIAGIPSGSLVLDLGCGAGLIAAELARRARVVGVDVSTAQLALARDAVPAAALVRADMVHLQFRPRSFDAVAAFWSLIHVRRELHAELLERIHGWIRPGGLFFGTLGGGDNPQEYEEDFFGAPMYWSHFDAETNRRLLRTAGFEVVLADEIEDAGEQPLWVIARVSEPRAVG